MGLRHWLLIALFGVHWLVFVGLWLRRRDVSRLLPIGVFTLLILTQVFWNSPAELHFGDGDPILLRTAFRHGAWTLAVPSVGMMFRRLWLRRSARRETVDDAS